MPSTEVTSPYVFISYASADRARVRPVVDAFREKGIEVWIDEDSIPGGAAYGSEIVDGIEGCRAFVLMCSAASLASDNVRQEIALAWKYRRPYIPLLLERVEIPREVEYWLEAAQWIEVLDHARSDWFPRVLAALSRYGLAEAAPAGVVSSGLPSPTAAVPTNLPPASRPCSKASRD